MESEPFQQAVRRIEDAIARLERVTPVSEPGPAPQSDARFAALEERHRRLRDGATAALDRLDRLIGSAAAAEPGAD